MKKTFVKKLLSLALAAAMGVMLLAGCGASGSASGTSESGAADGKEAGATAVEAAADAADASGQDADGQKTIGMVIKHAQTEFIQAFVIGANDNCKKYG